MTPERATELYVDYLRGDIKTAIDLVLAACTEQEREARHKALTEAAELLRCNTKHAAIDLHTAGKSLAAAIERLRDGG